MHLFGRRDGFIRRRLRAILRKQGTRPGMGRSEADHRRWTDVCFEDEGLFTRQGGYETARHSRSGQPATAPSHIEVVPTGVSIFNIYNITR